MKFTCNATDSTYILNELLIKKWVHLECCFMIVQVYFRKKNIGDETKTRDFETYHLGVNEPGPISTSSNRFFYSG